MDLSTALSNEAIVDTQSMYLFGNGMAPLNLLPNIDIQVNGSDVGGITSTATLMGSSIPSFSSGSTTTIAGRECFVPAPTPSPQLSPVTPRAMQSSPLHPCSPSTSSSTEQTLSEEDKKLIDMPYYQFKKLLDDPSIGETRKEDIKNIRRRGRNKMAAKLCRTKKMRTIVGLEQEVEQSRKTKSLINIRTKCLEREIAELKKKCLKSNR